MNVAEMLAHALVQGLASALPLSPSGHQLVLRIWLGSPRQLAALSMVAEIGCMAALLVVVRQRLLRAFADGVRGLAQPARLQSTDGGRDAIALALMTTVAATTEILLQPYAGAANQVPFVVAGGMLLTAAALLSTLFAPSPRRLSPAPAGALLTGLGFGLSIMPGASSLAVAFAVMRWLGVAHVRAAELAMMVAVFVLALRVTRTFLQVSVLAVLGPGEMALAVVAAFVGASLGASWWRSLCEQRRTPRLALWLVPLGLAVLGYGRALGA